MEPGEAPRRPSSRYWKRLAIVLCSLAALGLWTLPAEAIPVVAVDAAPSVPGVQTLAAVSAGDTFEVEVLISEVEEPMAVAGFSFELHYEASVAAAQRIVVGSFLPAEVRPVDLRATPGVARANALSRSATGATGSGVLARLTMRAHAEGSTPLELQGAILADDSGKEVPFELRPATLIVRVPEPGAASQAVAGSLGLVLAFATSRRRESRSGR